MLSRDDDGFAKERLRHARAEDRLMLRPAVAADLARLLEIRDTAGTDAMSDPAAIAIAEFARLIADGTVVVCAEGKRVVGFCAADCAGGRVSGLLVETGHRGRGTGRQLLAAALAMLKDAGHRQANLTLPQGSSAAPHYLNNGWVEAGHGENGELILRITLCSHGSRPNRRVPAS
jgi:GNAT superfamily N-acetyltransferase